VGAPITAGTSLSGKRVDLRDIRIVKKGGGTIDDSEMVDGLVFEHKASKAAGGPTKVTGAKIALIQFCVSPPKTDLESNIVLSGVSVYTLNPVPPASRIACASCLTFVWRNTAWGVCTELM
jgi:chaperonin GroEL (HSP60 family)